MVVKGLFSSSGTQEHIIKQESKKAISPLSFNPLTSQNKTLHIHSHQEQIEEHKASQKSKTIEKHIIHI